MVHTLLPSSNAHKPLHPHHNRISTLPRLREANILDTPEPLCVPKPVRDIRVDHHAAEGHNESFAGGEDHWSEEYVVATGELR